jgi:hypothetical protein
VAGQLLKASALGLRGLPVPCRVVWTVDEPDRIGFTYGTLQGHPAAGEESFVVTREPDGIYFTIRAYNRAAACYARLGGPAQSPGLRRPPLRQRPSPPGQVIAKGPASSYVCGADTNSTNWTSA